MLLLSGATVCCPLRSTCFHRLLHYYETVRLLIRLLIPSTSLPLKVSYRFRSVSDLPGMYVLLVCSPRSSTPTEPASSRLSTSALLPAACTEGIGFRSLSLRGSIASRFRIAALTLPCLRLNLTSRLWLQGWVLAACYALPDRDFHPAILHTPNWRTRATIATAKLPQKSIAIFIKKWYTAVELEMAAAVWAPFYPKA